MHVCWHCSRATGDAGSAITYYEESVEFLSKVPVKDLEVFFFFSLIACLALTLNVLN